jgi:hypothetical protein
MHRDILNGILGEMAEDHSARAAVSPPGTSVVWKDILLPEPKSPLLTSRDLDTFRRACEASVARKVHSLAPCLDECLERAARCLRGLATPDTTRAKDQGQRGAVSPEGVPPPTDLPRGSNVRAPAQEGEPSGKGADGEDKVDVCTHPPTLAPEVVDARVKPTGMLDDALPPEVETGTPQLETPAPAPVPTIEVHAATTGECHAVAGLSARLWEPVPSPKPRRMTPRTPRSPHSPVVVGATRAPPAVPPLPASAPEAPAADGDSSAGAGLGPPQSPASPMPCSHHHFGTRPAPPYRDAYRRASPRLPPAPRQPPDARDASSFVHVTVANGALLRDGHGARENDGVGLTTVAPVMREVRADANPHAHLTRARAHTRTRARVRDARPPPLACSPHASVSRADAHLMLGPHADLMC